MPVDVVIVGGGPAGLNAALMLGRATKSVVLFDSGPPRNAAAVHVHNFVTRDGVPPAEFRRIAREQLRAYASVRIEDARVEAIAREGETFVVRTSAGEVAARRVLLATGMIDELPDVPGYRELWGKSIFQCPYCHGWEVRGRVFGVLASAPAMAEWAILLRSWTRDVVVLTSEAFELTAETRSKLGAAGIAVEERRVVGLRARDGRLAAVQVDGGEVACEVLFARPPQRQTALVQSLGLALDEQGFVRVDEQSRTSEPGIYAAGDLTTVMQAAILAAATGVKAAAVLNHELTVELATAGQL